MSNIHLLCFIAILVSLWWSGTKLVISRQSACIFQTESKGLRTVLDVRSKEKKGTKDEKPNK